MAQVGSPAGFCEQGCYWDCEHRRGPAPQRAPAAAASDARPSKPRRWTLGPDPGDDPETRALDEWRLHTIAGVPFDWNGFDVPVMKYCAECGRSFLDSSQHSREHQRRRQLGGR